MGGAVAERRHAGVASAKRKNARETIREIVTGGTMVKRHRGRFLVACALALSTAWAGAATSERAAQKGGSMPHEGRSFQLDYGDLVIRVRYLSESRLEWEQIEGPQAGSKGEEEYGHAVVREDVVFFWWQEKDTSIVTQVVDFGRSTVHTTWTSPDKKLAAFQGEVRPLE